MDTWIKTQRSTYTLRRDDREVARVVFSRCGRDARVSGDGIDWTIERRGMLKPVVNVRTADGATLATARARFSGSYDLTTRDGFTARFRTTKALSCEYGWTASDGTPLITYSLQKWYRQNRTIAVRQSTADETLLLILGGVLANFSDSDAAAVTAVIVASAVAAGA